MKKLVLVFGVLVALVMSGCEKEEYNNDNYEIKTFGTNKGDVINSEGDGGGGDSNEEQ